MFQDPSLLTILVLASLALNAITLILVIFLFKRKPASVYEASAALEAESLSKEVLNRSKAVPDSSKAQSDYGIIFCRDCGSPYDSSIKECPGCRGQK